MNVLVIGSGGREHALTWKLSQSPEIGELHCAPGNPGMAEHALVHPIDVEDFESQLELCIARGIELVLVGPEVPLVKGIVDFFAERAPSIMIIGPNKVGAQLEGSKKWAKAFMERHDIPTAKHRTFDASQFDEACSFIKKGTFPVVLKADGLAAGKGVLICMNESEAMKGLDQILNEEAFGASGAFVVVEEFLSGIEFSVFALCDGRSYKILPTAKDYKRIGEGDSGLNTGGMGAVSPPPFVNDVLMQKVIDKIVEPTVSGLQTEGIEYKGFIFFGLISVAGEPYVIEYNARMGDPETQAVMLRLETDLLSLLMAVGKAKLSEQEIIESDNSVCTVVCASKGYPQSYEKGKSIFMKEVLSKKCKIFHSGTKLEGGRLLSNGGRVLALCASGESLADAKTLVMAEIEKIEFEGMYFRKDIGSDLL